jgi:HEAT repeat protein
MKGAPPWPDHSEPLTSTGDEELRSLKQVMSLLEKTFNAVRLYGRTNQSAQQFLQKLYDGLMAHLATFGVLSFDVQRNEISCRGKVVYQNPSQGGSLAFKLYTDGICGLTFGSGVSLEDLSSFLEVLGVPYDPKASDDDIVTRLWAKNLPNISIVTADEIVKNPGLLNALVPQDSSTLTSSLSSLKEVVAGVTASQVGADSGQTAASSTDSAQQAQQEASESEKGKSAQFQCLPVGIDVSQQDLDQLVLRIKAESMRDNTAYLLELVRAVLLSQDALVLFNEMLALVRQLLDDFIQQAKWGKANTVLEVLREARQRADLPVNSQEALSSILESLGEPTSIKPIEQALNASRETATRELLDFLLNLGPNAIPSLCSVLSELKLEGHRQTVREALSVLSRNDPEMLAKELADSRSDVVRNVLSVIGKVRDPGFAPYVEKLASHPDSQVRREALHVLHLLPAGGRGDRLVSLLADPDSEIRNSALGLLKTGKYKVPFSLWASVVTSKILLHRPLSEVRTIFKAMEFALGDESVPYLHRLVMQSLWTRRAQKQELGALAAHALGRIGTEAAVLALKDGQKRYNRTIRNACAQSLTTLLGQHTGKP